MSKQTAVEWLFTMLNNPNNDQLFAKKLLEKAKKIEKEQVVNAFEIGYDNGACVSDGESIYHGTNYYKKTYTSNIN